MKLTLDKCIIRPFERGDELSIVRHADNRNVWINLRDHFPHPYTTAHARAWIEEQIRSHEENHWAIEVDGHATGGIGLSPRMDVHRLSAEIGFWLGEAYWGRGIMTEAVGAVTRYAFHTRGFIRVFAEVFEWNPASMRVLEKNGFAREGVLRRSATKAGHVIDQVLFAAVAAAP
jgi:ribosomal-protein-alanine N-acetyltransferase